MPAPMIIAALAVILLGGEVRAQAGPSAPYAGEQARAVASLSAADISELLAGGGWGLAKPAELNGYPGPAHVLELADKLGLTEQQRKRVEQIHKRMQLRARDIGARYVAAEAAIDTIFKYSDAGEGSLTTRLRDAERLRAELRRAHLQAHLDTRPVLSEAQRKQYAVLRGYASATAPGSAGHRHHHKH